MITKKFTKHGNSRALVIEKAILDLLNIGEDTEVSITTDGTRLIISPIIISKQDRDDDPTFRWAAEKTLANHEETLRKLA